MPTLMHLVKVQQNLNPGLCTSFLKKFKSSLVPLPGVRNFWFLTQLTCAHLTDL